MMAEAGAGIEEGAADVRFVLDRITELNARSAKTFPLVGKLDLNKVATMGHSAGAEFAALAAELDARFKACVDLDGGMVPISALPEPASGAFIQQPLLFLEADHPRSRMGGSPEQIDAYLKKRSAQLQKCPPGSYAVVLNPPGIVHGSFDDTSLLESGDHPEQISIALHNSTLIQSYVLAFLDKSLKHLPAPALDDPNAPHPEATIERLGK